MGHFFSRAIKRFTQCRNQLPSQEQQEANQQQQQQQQQREIESRPIVQSIPVGQSIDSAEYAAFEVAREVKKIQPADSGSSASSRLAQIQENVNINTSSSSSSSSSRRDDKENVGSNNDENDDNQAQNTPQVEEAVIKIQALVRGHLTRKALKDAQQQAATPAPNALGQSQFDHESLIKNPPNAVLSPSSPLNTTTNTDLFNDHVGKANSGTVSSSSPISLASLSARVPPLESIAEETALLANDPHQSAQITTGSNSGPNSTTSRRKLSPINRSLAISTESRSDSMSPAPSETNASLDLVCETPTSASIDILDHNIRATDALASVLHHKMPAQEAAAADQQTTLDEQLNSVDTTRRSPRMIVEPPTALDQQQQQQQQASSLVDTPQSTVQQQQSRTSNMASLSNSHSIDSAEAAAIRIQSAYRGYHTRKNSPYRRRSPGNNSTSPPAMSLDNGIAQYRSTNCTDIPARAFVLRQQDQDNQDDGELLSGASSGHQDIAAAAATTEAVDRLQQALRDGRRQSRQRHRLEDVEVTNPDTANLQPGELVSSSSAEEITTTANTATTNEDQTTVRESGGGGGGGGDPQESLAATLEENSDATRISLAALDTVESIGDNQPSHKVTEIADAAASADAARQAPQTGVDNFSFELDTESSNLGAALSFNEDISEAVAKSFEETRKPEEDRSYGANLISDEQASEARRLVEQLTNEDEEEDEQNVEEEEEDKEASARQSQQQQPSFGNQDAALQEATDQLEAALEEATDDLDDNVAENLANAILDEDEQRNIEMESDDIERRDPSGLVSEDRAKSPQILTTDRQPALVSGSSIEEEEEQRQDQRLGVESPDEAIGSGRSSPALISSTGGGSSDEEGEELAEDKQVKTTDGGSGGRNQAGGGAGGSKNNNNSKKKNRNRKKARK